jgi:hypothetical protein
MGNPVPSARDRDVARQYLLSEKDKPCSRCGLRLSASEMRFVHRRDRTGPSVSTLATKGASIEVIAAEIAQCDLLCVPCDEKRRLELQNSRANRLQNKPTVSDPRRFLD